MAATRRERALPSGTQHLPSLVRTRVVPARATRDPGLERVSWLTPYAAETVAEDARHAGPGTRLEVTVARSTTAEALAAVELLFGWLASEGIEVRIQREAESADAGDGE